MVNVLTHFQNSKTKTFWNVFKNKDILKRVKHQYFLAIIYKFKRVNVCSEEILNNIIRHACHISTSRLGLTKMLEDIRSKLYINMLNRNNMLHLFYCKTFCKTGITEYSLENFLQSLTDLTNLPTCTNPGASSNE